MVEFLTIVLFLFLLALTYLGGRRALLSQSSNLVLYAGFTVISAASAGILIFGLLQGQADLMQGVVAVATLQAAWILLRGLSHAHHTLRRESDLSYHSGGYSEIFLAEPVRI